LLELLFQKPKLPSLSQAEKLLASLSFSFSFFFFFGRKSRIVRSLT
jgi:hypothetical protein